MCPAAVVHDTPRPQHVASARRLLALPLLAFQAKESDLQRSQMMMKLKESRLARLQAGGGELCRGDWRAAVNVRFACNRSATSLRRPSPHQPSSTAGGNVPAEVSELQQEIDLLRGKVEAHPEVKRFAVENLRLSEVGGTAGPVLAAALAWQVRAVGRQVLPNASSATWHSCRARLPELRSSFRECPYRTSSALRPSCSVASWRRWELTWMCSEGRCCAWRKISSERRWASDRWTECRGHRDCPKQGWRNRVIARLLHRRSSRQS